MSSSAQAAISEITSSVFSSSDLAVREYIDSVITDLVQASKLRSTDDLVAELGEMLQGYELVSSEQEAQNACAKVVQALQFKGVIPKSKKSPTSSKKSPTSPQTSVQAQTQPSADGPKKLNAPVRIADVVPVETKKVQNVSSTNDDDDQDDENEGNDGKSSDQEDLEPTQGIDVSELDYLERAQLEQELQNAKIERFLLSTKGVTQCQMCERIMPLTFHHLIPKTTHKTYKKKGYTQEQLNSGIDICRPCHSAIHRLIDEKTLARDFNTLEALLAHEGVQKFIAYACKQKIRTKEDSLNPKIRYKK